MCTSSLVLPSVLFAHSAAGGDLSRTFLGLMLVSFPVWNSLPLRDWGLMVFGLQFVCMIFEHLEKGLVFVAVAINSY